MRGIKSIVEVDTGVGTREGESFIHYRITRPGERGHRELLVDFDLPAADAFAIHMGGCRQVEGKIYDTEQIDRIITALGALVGLDEDAAIWDIVQALRPVLVERGQLGEAALRDLFDELTGEKS